MTASSGMPFSSERLHVRPFTCVMTRRQHLLLREVEDRLLARRELDRPLPQPADRLGDGQRARQGAPRGVGVHTDGGDEPDAFLVATPHLGPEHAWRHHADVAVGVEPVERERVPAGDDREPVGLAPQRQRRDHVVGHEHAHDVDVARVRQLQPAAKPSVSACCGTRRPARRRGRRSPSRAG